MKSRSLEDIDELFENRVSVNDFPKCKTKIRDKAVQDMKIYFLFFILVLFYKKFKLIYGMRGGYNTKTQKYDRSENRRQRRNINIIRICSHVTY